MIAVLAAVEIELAGLRRRLRRCQRLSGERQATWLGYHGDQTVLLCCTGVGRAEELAANLLDRHRPSLVLSVGSAGALAPGLDIGDVVICQSVQSTRSGNDAVRSDEWLLRLAVNCAKEARLPLRHGHSLTVDRIIADPAEKEALHHSTGADVVEMESYWIGRAAQEMGLPFFAVRTVLDGPRDQFPDTPNAVRPDGTLSRLRVLSYSLQHPGRLPSLFKLASLHRRALPSLTHFLEAFVGAFQTLPLAEPARRT